MSFVDAALCRINSSPVLQLLTLVAFGGGTYEFRLAPVAKRLSGEVTEKSLRAALLHVWAVSGEHFTMPDGTSVPLFSSRLPIPGTETIDSVCIVSLSKMSQAFEHTLNYSDGEMDEMRTAIILAVMGQGARDD